MLLKRKRSDDEFSSFSSPARVPADTVDVDVAMADIDSPFSAVTFHSPTSRSCTLSHLPSRTLKRLRNGRPSDHEVHQTTLDKLYRAQHRHENQQPLQFSSPPNSTKDGLLSAQSPPSPHRPLSAPASNQRSLHSFWDIPSKQHSPCTVLSSALPLSIGALVDRPTSCDDCGVSLGGEDAAVDDGYGFEAYIDSCSLCCKAVCFSCSVGNLGEQRRCLVCAGNEDSGRKRWVGGARWISETMTVF